MENSIIMGKMPDSWKDGMAKVITLCVTEDCNLACKYCYMTGKNGKNKMSFDTAKKAVDYFLLNKEIFNDQAVVWDFIGGEPFLEIDLIDKICDYIKLQMYRLNHVWFENYMFSFSTNGILYRNDKVQNYIAKNKAHLSISISVDGNKIKHDLQRVRPDNTGSYDEVIKNVPLWQEQFPNSPTKATFSHDDLPYLKDSIISLWENGIKYVSANVVFENVWNNEDDFLFENQLKELADYILDNELWKEYSVRFFQQNIGFPLSEEEKRNNWCGTGKMVAIDVLGNIYPCIRFCDFSLTYRKGYIIGDIYNGIDNNKLRPFYCLTNETLSSYECLSCEVASGCPVCAGCNYDFADSDTIFQRATYICKMHKANVRANEYFWKKFKEVTGIDTVWEKYKLQSSSEHEDRFLQFILSDDIKPNCSYIIPKDNPNKMIMSLDMLKKGLDFAKNRNMIPVFLGDVKNYRLSIDQNHLKFIPSADLNKINTNNEENIVVVYTNEDINGLNRNTSNSCILLLEKDGITNLHHNIQILSKVHSRINLIIQDITNWGSREINQYKEQLEKLVEFLFKEYQFGNHIDLNILTDIMNEKTMNNCGSGINSFALAPNGRIYICPGFYFKDPEDFIGTLDTSIEVKNKELLDIERSPLCKQCDAYHCRRCKFMNKHLTGQINIPSKIQCKISHLERNYSRKLQMILKNKNKVEFLNIIKEIDYLDPFEKITPRKGVCL